MLSPNASSDADVHLSTAAGQQNAANIIHHQRNACVKIPSLGLLVDCIKLAHNKKRHKWAQNAEMAENHPALMGLCAFWDHFKGTGYPLEARIPYIQVFSGGDHYMPLIRDGVKLPVKPGEQLRADLNACSVLFGDYFLVTFLAGRQVTASKPHHHNLHFYTVEDKPLFKEPLFFGQLSLAGRDSQNDLALRALKSLQQFPMRFEALWRWCQQTTGER